MASASGSSTAASTRNMMLFALQTSPHSTPCRKAMRFRRSTERRWRRFSSAKMTPFKALSRGALPGARLFAADVFGGEARGGAADAVARGLGWLAEKEVAVIAISLAGPQNALIESAISALVARGHVVVAAAGNDGPAAAPVYPGAYPSVIAVTSVDEGRRLQLDAGRGPHIAFAALGVDIEAAALGGGYAPITGTSYAVPRVAGIFAIAIDAPSPAAAASALDSVKAQAIDLGDPGRDSSFGYGYLDGAAPTASLAK
jgi:subtilisin family serine protease